MSSGKRIVAILHLCLVFTVISWSGGYPFMGELYHIKSRKMLYETVLSDSARFSALPQKVQENVQEGYLALETDSKTPFLTKLGRSWNILAFYLSPFFQAWILFSLAIPILLLFRVEGAALASWILPLLVILYAWDNIVYGAGASAETKLFPTEEYLITNYLYEPFSPHISEQKEQLTNAWHAYLIREWSEHSELSEGQYTFNIARIQAQAEEGPAHYAWRFREKESPALLLLYFAWNLFFAISLNRQKSSIH